MPDERSEARGEPLYAGLHPVGHPFASGTNLALLNGIQHELVANGWLDRHVVDAHTVARNRAELNSPAAGSGRPRRSDRYPDQVRSDERDIPGRGVRKRHPAVEVAGAGRGPDGRS